MLSYLDPGSGSIIAGALVGGTAAAGVALKSAMARFGGRFKKQKETDSADPAATADPPTGQNDA